MSPLRMLYLALAILGAAVPLASVLRGGLLFGGAAYHDAYYLVFVPDWGGLIALVALSVWAIAETSVRRNWSALVALPAAFFIGLGCGLPLYLFLRTRPVT